MFGWVSKIIGPKVLLGLLVATLAGLAVTGWGWKVSAGNVAALERDLLDAETTIDSLLTSADVGDDVQTAADERDKAMKRELDAMRSQLEVLKNEASDDVRRCGDVVLPAGLADGLRE